MSEVGDQSEEDQSAADAFFEGVGKKLEEKKQRRRAASVVRDWLEQMKKNDTVDMKDMVRYAVMAEKIHEALRTHGIGFIVKDDPMASRITSRRIEGLFLDAEKQSGESSTFVIPTLQIRKGTTVQELLKDPSGKLTLSHLYRMNRTYGEKEGRVSADAAAQVEEEGFGTFPNLDE